MALAKYAEDNLEMFYERMAMRDYIPAQESFPSVGRARTESAQKPQNEKGA